MQEHAKTWSAFIKMDDGHKYVHRDVLLTNKCRDRRAGMPLESESFKSLREAFASNCMSCNFTVWIFYVHARNAYASTLLEEATSMLTGEVRLANDAAALALEVREELGIRVANDQPFVLSVGSTPTAQSATAGAK